ncbi:multi-sensor hybrid histidine kinase [Calothrix sp. NIES-2098]|nr:multi-sensor hybrid histidine kinase [Calothrix sp. NIES-2098]
MFKFKRQIWSYGVAIASVTIATLLMLVLNPDIELTKTSFLLFFGAVTISAWYGGREPGVLATLLSALCATYFFLEPVGSLSLTFASGTRVALFVLEGCLISVLVGSLRIAQQQTKESLCQLKASEAKFRRLIDSNIIGVISADIYNNITDANDAFLNSLGYTREDLLAGRIRWDEITPADLKHLDVPAYEELITKGKNTPYEKALIGKQGQRVPMIVGAALLEDDPEQIISFILDISQRKQAEAALRNSEMQLRLLTDSLPVLISYVDAQCRYRFVNQIYTDWFGLSPEEIVGKHVAEIIGQEAYQAIRPDIEIVMSGQKLSSEKYVLFKTAGWRYVQRYFVPDMGEDGIVQGFYALIIDVTDRRQAEESLRQSEERLRVALKNAPIAVFHQDRQLRYTWIENRTFEYQIDRVLGKTDNDFVCPEEAAILTRIKQQVLETGIGRREEVKLTQLGREYYYDLTVEPLQDANGVAIGVTCAAIDISELKHTELELRQSEERFRLLAEQVQVIPWEIDPKTGNFTYVGPQAVEFLGYPLTAWYADNFWIDTIYLGDREWVPQLFYENSLSLDNYAFEYRMLAADGRIVWLYDVVNVVRQNQEPKLLRGIMVDITQRKRQEETQKYLAEVTKVLASSLDYQTTLNQFAQQMVPHLADWCIVHMPQEDGSIQPVVTAHVNPAKVQWVEEIRQRYPLNQDDLRGIPQVLRTGQSEFYPNIPDALLVDAARDPEHLRLLREIGFRSVIIVPMQAHGKTLGTLTLVAAESGRSYDRTDLALAEELARRAALAVDNARLYQQTQQTQQIAEQFANRTNVLQQITAALSQALTPQQVADVVMRQGIEAIGANAGSVALLVEQGTTLKILQAIGYPESMMNQWSSFPITGSVPLAKTARTGEPLFLENAAVMLAQYPHLAESIATTGNQAFACLPLIAEGRLLGVMGLSFTQPQAFTVEERAFMLTLAQQSAQAISRAHLYEAERIARNAAEAANRVKDEFLAVLSHELRTPLNPILGWSKLLQTGKLDQAKTAQALNTIVRNAKLQVELIEDLLDVSRILRGKLSLNISGVDLVSTIEAALETVRLSAIAKSIQIQTILEPGIGLVSGDSSRLQQVVWNLLANAIKFTPHGGRVEVKLSLIASDASNDKYAEITVSDTGKGIHPDFLPYVFDYFRQEDGATTRKFGGLGLGLAIARHLVELHGGMIWAESPGEGQGATFTMRLPLMPIPNQFPTK